MVLKLLDLLVLTGLLLLPLSTSGEVFDVTTIYDVRQLCENVIGTLCPIQTTSSLPVRVHKRTNALGLQLSFNGKPYKENPKSNLSVLCDVKSSCDWERNGWIQGEIYQRGSPYSVTSGLKIAFSSATTSITNWDEQRIHLAFTSNENSVLKQQNIYVLEIVPTQSAKVFPFCHHGVDDMLWASSVTLKYPNNEHVNLKCNPSQAVAINSHSTFEIKQEKVMNPNYQREINFYYDDVEDDSREGPEYINQQKLYCNGSHLYLPSLPSENNYVTFYWDDHSLMKAFLPSEESGLKSTNVGSTLTSPKFSPNSKTLCLALVVNCSKEIAANVLQISVRDLLGEEHVLITLNSFEAGLQVKHLNSDISKISAPISVIIKQLTPVEMAIHRVSTCSSIGSETEVTPRYATDPFLQNWKTLPAFYVSSVNTPVTENIQLHTCLNGGVQTTTGCACTPGFIGSHCQTGCGRNRFGHDCGGKCSSYKRECEGMILCTQLTGCKCAPGYTGITCKTKCPSGNYGNDCSQQCGHCADDPCDVFTGLCTVCAPGYWAPYCVQEYDYLSSPPALKSEQYETIQVSFNLQEVKGYGKAKLYQIQYREKIDDTEWTTYVTKSMPTTHTHKSNTTQEIIDGLKDGTLYEVRVLLMEADFNKYDGKLVKFSEVRTKCYIPDKFDYNIHATIRRSTITFAWNYNPENKHWCQVNEFEVSWTEDLEWLTSRTNDGIFTLTDLLPGSTIDFNVRAKTVGGDAPFSEIKTITTEGVDSRSVVDLQVLSTESTSLDLSWNPPPGSDHFPIKYTITCKCVRQVACPTGCGNASELRVVQTEPRVVLGDLLPFTQYLLTVTPEDGPASQIYAGTSGSLPTEVPGLSYLKPLKTNTSVTVFWEPVVVCTSFLQGYKYQLTKIEEDSNIIADGFTIYTRASFHNLTAGTQYVVKVFINNMVGWNPESFLSINVTTSARVPEAVRNLTVYKKGRSMLGLRWAEPRILYGQLESFVVQYKCQGQQATRVIVKPTSCTVWPQLYCHTLENFKSNRNYTVVVSARNVEVKEDGDISSVTEITKEGAPTVPQNLTVHNSSSTTIGLKWRYPDMANGIVRSFVITVEETEMFDQDACCQDFPLIEIIVKEELVVYSVEISGLRPAATYYASVSAKTVTMGPAQSLIVSTRPPHLPVRVLPSLQLLYETYLPSVERNITWLSQENLLEVNSSDVFSPLIKTQLVMMVLNGTHPFSSTNTGMKDNQQLSALLKSSIGGQFYFLAEYNKDGLLSDSQWGQEALPPGGLEEGLVYQLLAVQVTDYTGVYNIDLRYSTPFVYRKAN